jgi:ATP-binding cassette subfamily F protein 3
MITSEERVKQIEAILSPHLLKVGLPESYVDYVANMLIEDPPRSGIDLNQMIGDFFQNDINQDPKVTETTCETIYNDLSAKNLISQEGNNIWIAEKMNAPLLMNDVELISDKEQAEGYADTPFTYEKFTFTLNDYLDEEGTEEDREEIRKRLEEKKRKEAARKKKKEADAFEKHMQKLKAMRKTMPPMEVIHNKKVGSGDIRVEGVDLEVPGKVLLSQADFILGRGRKYGLIGRNGIGKTTLLYAICRREFKGLESMPQVLLVEQEVQGDERTVLETILSTDKTRSDLLAEEKELLEGDEESDRLTEIYERLDEIDADQAEPKARVLLHGLGFSQEM